MKLMIEKFLDDRYESTFKIFGAFIFLYSLSNYFMESLTHMTTSNIVPGISPHLNMGIPYENYWDVYPPGIYIFYYLLYFITYDNFFAYSILHTVILASCIFFSYKIYKKLETPIFVYYVGLTYFLSPLYIDYLLPNDLIGLFFSFLGLYLYLYLNDGKKKYIYSNFFLIFAFLIKETFFLSSFTIISILLIRGDAKGIKYSLYGIFSSFLFLLTFTETLSITKDVIDSYVIKFEIFSFEEIILKGLPLLVISFIFLVFIKFKPSNVMVKKLSRLFNEDAYIVFVYSALMLLSYLLINKDDGGHFDIPKIFAVIFLLNILFRVNVSKLFIALLIILASGFALKLNHSMYSYLLIEPNFKHQENLATKNISPDVYKLLAEDSSEFLYLYGWGSSDVYYELKVMPYSKYWIIHPGILSDKQIDEFKTILKNKPPKYIFYCGLNDNCVIDFDYKNFELEYINFNKIITDCYQKIDENIFTLVDLSCTKEINF